MMTPDAVRTAVISAARKITKDTSFTANDGDKLADLGLDSLDRMSLLVEVESILKVEFGEVDPEELSTMGDYVSRLAA